MLQATYNQTKTAQLTQTSFDVVKGRDKKVTEKLICDNLSEDQRSGIKAVSMNMWESYIIVISNLLPSADIVHDKFHIVKYLKDAVDKERKKEVKTETILKNSKYTMLKNEHNLTEKQYIHFEEIMASDLQTTKACGLAETFRAVLDSSVIAEAYAYFDMWISEVKKSGIATMQKVAKTFMNHITGIINYVKHRITNAKNRAF